MTIVAASLWKLVCATAPALAQDSESEPAVRTPPGIAYAVTIEVSGGTDDLKKGIEEASNLKALEGEPPAGPVGLVRRAQADFARVQSVLNADGFYGGLIGITVAGVPVAEERAVDAAAAAALRGPVPVGLRVEAGSQFVFGVITLADNATGSPPPPVPVDVSELGLTPGSPALARLVLAAEGNLVDQMQDLGYPLAGVPRRQAIADHSNNTLDVTFFLAPGRQANIGTVEVRGATTISPEFVARQANVKPGTRYSREEIDRIRNEVTRLDVFRSVRVVEGDSITPDGQIPLIIQVEERKPRFVGFGASYSSTEGATISGYWGHRNLFGHAEKLRIEGEVSRLFSNSVTDLQYVGKATFEKPGFITAIDDLLIEARAFREVPEAYEATGGEGKVAWRRRFTERFEGQIGVAVEHERITDAVGTGTFTMVSIPVAAKYDSTDDKLDPSKGFRAGLEVAPYPTFLGSTVGMTSVQGYVSAYHSFDAARRFILAGRILAGTISGPNVFEIPADKRFYAGGGGTIRGYDYQGVSPRLPDGQIIGGKSLFVASAEARIRITDTIGIVPFVDAGGAFTSGTPTFDSDEFKVGAGLGLRYYTAIGPLRVDVAVPLERGPWDPSFALYVGLGQAF